MASKGAALSAVLQCLVPQGKMSEVPTAYKTSSNSYHQDSCKEASEGWSKRYKKNTKLEGPLAQKAKEFGIADLNLNTMETYTIVRALTELLRDTIPTLAWLTKWPILLVVAYTGSSVISAILELQGNIVSAFVGIIGLVLRFLRYRVAQPRAFRMFSMLAFGESQTLFAFPKVPTTDEEEHREIKLLQGLLTAAKHKGRYTGDIEEEWKKYDAWQQKLIDATIEWEDGYTNFLRAKAEVIKIWSFVEFIAAVICVATPGKSGSNVIFFLPIAIKALELLIVLISSTYRKEAMVTVRDGIGEYLAHLDSGTNFLFRVFAEPRPCCSCCSDKWKTSTTKFLCTRDYLHEVFIPDFHKARLGLKMACPCDGGIVQFADVYRRVQETEGGYVGAYSKAPDFGNSAELTYTAPSAPVAQEGIPKLHGTENVPGETAIPITE